MSSDPNQPHDTADIDVVVTGASGFLGQDIVPFLEKAGYRLLLCGRDVQRLAALYPGRALCEETALEHHAKGAKALLHLAVHNNDQSGDETAFMNANLEGLKSVLSASKAAGIAHVIYPGSLQAGEGKSPYAKSKYAAEHFLLSQKEMRVTLLRLPAVYSTQFKGKLGVLNRLPATLRPAGLAVLGAWKPAVSIERVCHTILEVLGGRSGDEIVVCDPQSGNPVYRGLARTIDLSFALIIIALFWWLLAAVWLLVRLSSSGPGFYAQARVGKLQNPFTCYKFRTMQLGTKLAGTHEVSEASVTRIGGFLRRSKIDELPQVLNILKGDLSLVGPRPCLPVQGELIAARQARGVFNIRPGITGLAQVQGVDMSAPVRLAILDERYKMTRCLSLDVSIILSTFVGKGSGDNTATSKIE